MVAKKSAKKSPKQNPLPSTTDWRTTDQDEIHRRIQCAIDEKHSLTNLHPEHPVFSNFRVVSPSAMVYQTEIRDLATRAFSCTCPDFRINGLGTCKHIEATLIWLKRRAKSDFKLAEKSGSTRYVHKFEAAGVLSALWEQSWLGWIARENQCPPICWTNSGRTNLLRETSPPSCPWRM